jgi:hypothetical protein
MFCFSIFLVLQSLLLVCHLLPSPLSLQPLITYLPTHSLFPRLLACSFFYSFLTYLLTRFPICSLLAYLFACLFIHPSPPICLFPHHLFASITCHSSPTCIACLCHMVIYTSRIQIPIELVTLGSSPPFTWYYPLIYLCRF